MYYVASKFAGSSGPNSYTLCVFNGARWVLPPIGQPSEEKFYDCFYACKATVRITMGFGLESVGGLDLAFGLVLWLGLVSGL